MSGEGSEQDKSEAATPFKLDQARRKGTLARGTDLGFASILVATAIAAQASGTELIQFIQEAFRRNLTSADVLAGSPEALMAHIRFTAEPILAALILPVALLVFVCGTAEIVQNGGVRFTAHPLKPDFSRLNPAKGLKRVFSLRMLREVAKGVLKLALYVFAAWLLLRHELQENAGRATDARQLAMVIVAATGRLLLIFLLIAGFLAAIDQILARREFAKQMRMSRRDVTREAREREGEPRQKQRRKQVLAEIVKQAASAANVRGSDVLIVNPTHFAVALRYRPSEDAAPVVRAMGRNLWARRMREAAERDGITVVRNPSLARALFREMRVGATVGGQHYAAVADIYIMLKRAMQLEGRD